MSMSQRRKGRAFEQELVRELKEALGPNGVRRCWEKAMNKGHDVDIPGFAIEAKRRQSISTYAWMDQAVLQAKQQGPGVAPVLVMRADRRESLVVMRLDDWVKLVQSRAHESEGEKSTR